MWTRVGYYAFQGREKKKTRLLPWGGPQGNGGSGWKKKPKPLFSNNMARFMAENPTKRDFDY